MKATSNNSQLSLFDFSPPPVVTAPMEYDVPARLQDYWSNSMDLAFSLINKLFDELFKEDREKLMEFVEYVKACKLAETSEASRPLADRLFDAYAESLGSLHFTRIDRDGTEVVRTETTVLDFLVDVSFDEEELDNLLAWKMGTPSSKVDELYLVIMTHGMQAVRLTLNDLVDKENAIAKSNDHPYVIMLKRLGISEDIIPDPSDKDSVLKAMLDGIGASTDKFDSVLAYTDITPQELLAAGGFAERKRLNKMLARKLGHELASFSGSTQWYRHAGFWRNEILLTEGVMHLAEHGGRNFGTAFWFIDVIASYQGEKKLVRQPFQVWKFIADPPGEDGTWNSGKVVCENGNDKVIVEQVIEYTDFLLENIMVYASYEPVDEAGKKKRTIILLTSEY